MRLNFSKSICFILFIVAVLISILVYYQTKKSYLSVGFNNGLIHANHTMIEKVKRSIGEVKNCKEFDNNFEVKKIAKVKTENLYLVKTGNSNIEFCNYK